MNYTSSQSYHTLNHWQSNGAISGGGGPSIPEVSYDSWLCCYVSGGEIIPFASYAPPGFEPYETYARRPIPVEPNNIICVEHVLYNNQNYYIILADKYSGRGLDFDNFPDFYTANAVSDIYDNEHISNLKFSSSRMHGMFDVYSLFVVVGDSLPSWVTNIAYESSVPEDARFYYPPFNKSVLQGSGSDDEVLAFTPIADSTAGVVNFKSQIAAHYLTDEVTVRDVPYARMYVGNMDSYNYFNREILTSGSGSGVSNVKYIDNSWFTAYGSTFINSGILINTTWLVRERVYLAPVSDSLFSTSIYKLRSIIYD